MRPYLCRHLPAALVAALLLVLTAPPSLADGPKLGWADTAEFSLVATSGNTESQTFGFKDKLTRTWERSLFTVNAGGIRVETTTTDHFAVGPDPNLPFSLRETKTTTLTAENYYLNGRSDHKITDEFFWFAGAGWDRNTFAGIQNRYTGFGGVGNIWVDGDRIKFRTDYAATFTHQEDVVKDPNTQSSFAGARLSSSLLKKLGSTTTYTNDLVVDENLNDTKDLRANMINSLSIAMSKKLALKVSLQWLYDNEPSFKDIVLLSPNIAPPPKLVPNGTVPFQLDKLDTLFTTSLVVNF
jgi:putative salt-induced outer membrane protein YdiY